MSPQSGDVAYYYPEPYWLPAEDDWIKTILLFFDSIAILLPSYMYGRHRLADVTLAGELEDRELLHVLPPEVVIDEGLGEQLSEILVELVAAGAFDGLESNPSGFRELSRSRLGWSVTPELSEMIFRDLEQKGLAAETGNDLSVALHPAIRSTVLVLLAQLMRVVGENRGLRFQPVTSIPVMQDAFRAFFSAPELPSAGSIVTRDLRPVSLDLSKVSLDDLLDYRGEYASEISRYMRNVRSFVGRLSMMNEYDRTDALKDRAAEIEEIGREIEKGALRRWGKPVAKFALGIAGGVWSLKLGDPFAAATSFGLGALELSPEERGNAGAYSFLFRMSRDFGV